MYWYYIWLDLFAINEQQKNECTKECKLRRKLHGKMNKDDQSGQLFHIMKIAVQCTVSESQIGVIGPLTLGDNFNIECVWAVCLFQSDLISNGPPCRCGF